MSTVREMFAGREDELPLFDTYRTIFAIENSAKGNTADVEGILEPWAENKSKYLWDLMGKQLIISKDITYNVPEERLLNDMIDALNKYRDFVYNLIRIIADKCGREASDCVSDILNAYTLIDNSIEYSFSLTINGKTLSFSRGQKVIRVLGKICREIGMEEEFEKFRIAHSLVLNQSKLSGNLCLSIHPLDYATASDNASGWSSCMSWQEGGGYRLGTVEMMTSPMVICAYLASENMHLDICGSKWNSKKWRAWIIVHNDFIVVNRNYPYDSEDISTICVEWVKELAAKNLGWHYDKCCHWKENYPFRIETNFMYNDIGCCDHVGCYSKNFDIRHVNDEDCIYVNISGPAVCMNCGSIINPYDDSYDRENTAEHLVCANCAEDVETCECCGCYIYTNSDEVYYGPDDLPYCAECYNNKFNTCEICNNTYDDEDVIEIVFPFDHKWQENKGANIDDRPSYTPRMHVMEVCKECLEEMGLDKEDLIYSPVLEDYEFTGFYTCNLFGSYMLKPYVPYEVSAEIFNFPTESNYFKGAWEYNNQKLQESYPDMCENRKNKTSFRYRTYR